MKQAKRLDNTAEILEIPISYEEIVKEKRNTSLVSVMFAKTKDVLYFLNFKTN